jgi:uncharacterized membrane protein
MLERKLNFYLILEVLHSAVLLVLIFAYYKKGSAETISRAMLDSRSEIQLILLSDCRLNLEQLETVKRLFVPAEYDKIRSLEDFLAQRAEKCGQNK